MGRMLFRLQPFVLYIVLQNLLLFYILERCLSMAIECQKIRFSSLLFFSNCYTYASCLIVQILWPECGWRPISLTDLITAASVKKEYRKATLCIHPDKVQQKGANLQQKYIAEKVFDLLKVWLLNVILDLIYQLLTCSIQFSQHFSYKSSLLLLCF